LLIIRVTRLIFSLEKNRKFFKTLFPTKLLGNFIDIGNYKHNLILYNNFLNEFNSFSKEDLNDIKAKAINVSILKEFEHQTIGGYAILELIVRNLFFKGTLKGKRRIWKCL